MKAGLKLILSGLLAIAGLRSWADSGCANVSVRAEVQVAREELSLADVLDAEVCPAVRKAAAGISLGATPRLGGTRVLEGGQVRRFIEGMSIEEIRTGKAHLKIPERVLVHGSGVAKSCVEIAQFLEGTTSAQNSESASLWGEDNLDCSAARIVPAEASLELIKSEWNAGLRRWEFALRCAEPTACIPFLVWTRPQAPAQLRAEVGSGLSFARREGQPTKTEAGEKELLVKRGQTVILTWDHGGIRVALPVTSLEAGVLGQVVRVQLKSVVRIMRAEVIGERIVQARL